MYSPEQVPGAILLRRSICIMQIWIVHVDIKWSQIREKASEDKKEKTPPGTLNESNLITRGSYPASSFSRARASSSPSLKFELVFAPMFVTLLALDRWEA